MLLGIQFSILIIGLVIIILILWIKRTNELILEYNSEIENDFNTHFDEIIPILKEKQFNEEQIDRIKKIFRKKIKKNKLDVIEKEIDQLVKTPGEFFRKRFNR